MNALSTASRLVNKYGVEGAKAKVWHRLAHWTLRGVRGPRVRVYEAKDFWMRVGNGVSRSGGLVS